MGEVCGTKPKVRLASFRLAARQLFSCPVASFISLTHAPRHRSGFRATRYSRTSGSCSDGYIEPRPLALFLQMVTFRPRFIAVTTGRTRARFFSLVPLVIGRGRDISLFDRVFPCRFSSLCARRSFFLLCLLPRSLFCVKMCMFDLALRS